MKNKSVFLIFPLLLIILTPELIFSIQKANAPKGFVDVKSVIPDIVLDIRYATANNFTGEILDGFLAPRAFLLPAVAEALKRAQSDLKKIKHSLKIFDAYRPLRSERHMVRWARKNKKMHLLKEGYVPSYISPKRLVGHTSGNTVDITIVDQNGKELDMGTGFDVFNKKSWTKNAKGRALKNRMLLKRVLEARGFVNYYREWWHFVFPKAKRPARDIIIKDTYN